MIIFYNKKTSEIIGHLEGRVHFDEHLRVDVSHTGVPNEDIGRVIIGYTEDGDGKREEHNMHLWNHQIEFENPRSGKRPHNHKVKLDKDGKVEALTPLT